MRVSVLVSDGECVSVRESVLLSANESEQRRGCEGSGEIGGESEGGNEISGAGGNEGSSK